MRVVNVAAKPFQGIFRGIRLPLKPFAARVRSAPRELVKLEQAAATARCRLGRAGCLRDFGRRQAVEHRRQRGDADRARVRWRRRITWRVYVHGAITS